MAIVLQPPGYAKLYAGAGRIVGEAKRAERESERAADIAGRLLTMQNQQEMAVFNNQLALDRAKFAQLMDFELDKRSQQWQIEKMELRSRLDFQEEEAERLKRTKLYNQAIEDVKTNQTIPNETTRAQIIFDLEQKRDKTGIPSISAYKQPPKEKGPTEAELARAVKYLGEYEESKWYQPFGKEPTEEERALKTHYEKLVSDGLSTKPYTPVDALPTPKTKAEYDALPAGTKYIHPQLGERIKR